MAMFQTLHGGIDMAQMIRSAVAAAVKPTSAPKQKPTKKPTNQLIPAKPVFVVGDRRYMVKSRMLVMT